MKTNTAGEFIRSESSFRNWVSVDGRSGPSGEGGFQAEPRRYHLYVSYACPWAHRTLIFRKLKRLEEVISMSVVHPLMPPESWVFGDYPGSTPDHVHGFSKLSQLYEQSAPGFDGLVTVPVLYDKARRVIVNNESSEIIRMLNGAFDEWGRSDVDYYPEPLRGEIDAINAIVYENVNNGMYRAGFAKTQSAYEAAFDRLFETLDDLERRLSAQRYLVGERLTEADWRLFTTLCVKPLKTGRTRRRREDRCGMSVMQQAPQVELWTRPVGERACTAAKLSRYVVADTADRLGMSKRTPSSCLKTANPVSSSP